MRAAALAVRALLDELALPSFVKTSGSKGFHIVVPLDGAADSETVWRFAQLLRPELAEAAGRLEAARQELCTRSICTEPTDRVCKGRQWRKRAPMPPVRCSTMDVFS